MVVTKGTRKQSNGIGGMSHRTAAWFAWSLCAVCVVLITLALVLDFMTEEFSFDVGGFRYSPSFAVLTGVLSLAYPAVGALIFFVARYESQTTKSLELHFSALLGDHGARDVRFERTHCS
jgi:hypothetical protein